MDLRTANSHDSTSRFHAADGVELAVEMRGPADAPAVLFAHGFGQSRRAWTRAARDLAAARWRTVTFDARGHGDSDREPQGRYRLESFVADLVAVAGSLGTPPVLIGASMGGLLGLVAAGEVRPDPFRALVLVDITPRWEAAGVARMLDFMRSHPDGFATVDAAAAEVAAYLPQRRRRKDRNELAQLLRRSDDGRLHWHWDPVLLTRIPREAGAYQQRLLTAARRVDVPVLLVSGARSDVVSGATIREFLNAVPQARHIVVPRAAHTVAGDDNAAFTAAIETFLRSLDGSAGATPRTAAAAQ